MQGINNTALNVDYSYMLEGVLFNQVYSKKCFCYRKYALKNGLHLVAAINETCNIQKLIPTKKRMRKLRKVCCSLLNIFLPMKELSL